MRMPDFGSPKRQIVFLCPDPGAGEEEAKLTAAQVEVLVQLGRHALAYEGFEEMTWEAMGDFEAKFFVPGRPHARDLVEVKNHRLRPSEFWKEGGAQV